MPNRLRSSDIDDVRRGLSASLAGTDHGKPGDDPDDDPAMAERFAALCVAMGQIPEAGHLMVAAALDALEEAGDARAAGILSAVAVLARPPLATRAREVLARLHGAGVRSSIEDQVGTLEVQEARRLAFGPGEVLAITLGRPGTRKVQGALVIVETETTKGAAVGGSLSPPGTRREMEKALRTIAGAVDATAPAAVPTDTLTEALRTAFARTAEEGITVSMDLGVVVPILARALTKDPEGFAEVAVEGSHHLEVDPADDDEFDEVADELAEHLVECNDDDPVIERSGPLVARAMAEYKWVEGEGGLGSWTTSDLDSFLVDYLPRTVPMDLAQAIDAPQCVLAFLSMLDDHDVLVGDSLEDLAARLEEKAEEFLSTVLDGRRGAPATATGGAVPAPRLVVGDDEDLGSLPTPRLGRPVPKATRSKQRKSQRAARRRNRR